MQDFVSKVPHIFWWEKVVPPFAFTSLLVCIVAQVLFYAFPRFRTFPRSILSWLNYYNCIYLIYMLIKWTKTGPAFESMVTNMVPNSTSCRLTIFINLLTLRGTSACTTLICLTMFLVVVLHKEIEDHGRYKWGYLAFALLYPVGFSILPSYAATVVWDRHGECVIKNPLANKFYTLPYLVFLAFQIFFLAATMIHIRKTVTSVSHNVSKSMPIVYVFLRFIATVFAQLVNVFPAHFMLSFPEISDNDIFHSLVVITRLIGPILDAFVLILGNVEFTDRVHLQFSRFYAYVRTKFFGDIEQIVTPPEGSKDSKPSPDSSTIAFNNCAKKSDSLAKLEEGVITTTLSHSFF